MTQVVERATPSARTWRDTSPIISAPNRRRSRQWLTALRESALASFERLGFPTTKLEQWRFTSVAPITEKTFALATDGLAAVNAGLTDSLSGGAAVAVCVERPFAPALSSLSGLPKGVQVLSLEQALVSSPALCGALSGEARHARDTQAFTALEHRIPPRWIVILVAPAAISKTPHRSGVRSVTSRASPTVSHPRLLSSPGEASQAQGPGALRPAAASRSATP
jgi:Fe-S cluster assembly protein SufD